MSILHSSYLRSNCLIKFYWNIHPEIFFKIRKFFFPYQFGNANISAQTVKWKFSDYSESDSESYIKNCCTSSTASRCCHRSNKTFQHCKLNSHFNLILKFFPFTSGRKTWQSLYSLPISLPGHKQFITVFQITK